MKKVILILISILVILSLSLVSVSASAIYFSARDIRYFTSGVVYQAPDSVLTGISLTASSFGSNSDGRALVAGDINHNKYIFGPVFNFTSDNNLLVFHADYTYSIEVSYQLEVVMDSDQGFSAPYPLGYYISDFASTAPGYSPSSSGVSHWYNVAPLQYSVVSTVFNRIASSFNSDDTRRTDLYQYTSRFAFRLPSDYSYTGTYLALPFVVSYQDFEPYDQLGTGSHTAKLHIQSINSTGYYDPDGEIIEEVGADMQDVIDAQVAAAAQAHADQEALQELIEGDGSFGSPESGFDSEVDNFELLQSEFLDELGYDTIDDAFDNLIDRIDWDANEDRPNAQTALWVNKIINPVIVAFPIFVAFPLIIGLVDTLLGRRSKL